MLAINAMPPSEYLVAGKGYDSNALRSPNLAACKARLAESFQNWAEQLSSLSLSFQTCFDTGLFPGGLRRGAVRCLPRRRLKIYFDGGCRPNPGALEAAVVARGATYFFDDLGYGISSDAEWLALRLVLQLAQSLGEPDFDLVGDSLEVTRDGREGAFATY